MEHGTPKASKLLPSNAYTKLAPGEVYRPIVSAGDRRAEVTLWSVSFGLLMVVVFSAACIYIALRAGNGIEAAIPIAILAIFFGKLRKVRSTILENVIVQSIGQASGVVAAGAAFLIPALYINRLEVAWWHIFLATFVGGVLGVVLIIPLRKYFVKDLHGDLPFPEGTAINEVLVTGESAGKSSGKILLASFGLGAIYDFLVEGVHAWNPTLTTKTLMGRAGEALSNLRIDLSLNGIAALFGLGYIIGLRYAAIIAAGSILSTVVLVPMVYLVGAHAGELSFAGKTLNIGTMSSGAIFAEFVRPIGIGAIAASAIIGIIRMGKIILSSVSLGFKGLRGGAANIDVERTQRDLHPRNVLLIQAVSVVLMALVFFIVAMVEAGDTYSTAQCLMFALVGAVVGFIFSFLFTPVAAQAIAIVGTNPVSGMSLITVVLTILVLVATGLSGSAGMFIALIVGCAVCTALSTSGALISDFKVGYWIGSTPRSQQVWKFAGIAVAALVVALVIPLMDSAYHFVISDGAGGFVSNTSVLPAPQANMIAKVAEGLLSDPSNQPWLLYALGAVVAIVLYMAGVPMLAFALGMYLPLSINLGVLAGAFVSYLVGRSGKTELIKSARREQGILIASGLMAGAAIVGIITAVLRQPGLGAPIRFISLGENFTLKTTESGDAFLEHVSAAWFEGVPGQAISLVALLGLSLLAFVLAKRGADMSLAEQAEADAALAASSAARSPVEDSADQEDEDDAHQEDEDDADQEDEDDADQEDEDDADQEDEDDADQEDEDDADQEDEDDEKR